MSAGRGVIAVRADHWRRACDADRVAKRLGMRKGSVMRHRNTWFGIVAIAAPLSTFGEDAAPAPVAPPEFVKFSQPWTPPAAAFRSRVHSCANPIPRDRVALDDFEFEESGEIRRIRWWGVLLSPEQVDRPYYIAIYLDVDCGPDQMIYETCVIPNVQPVDINCLNQSVFRFGAQIPPVAINAGEHYWLQISEIDALSANVGQDDFLWAGRQPAQMCNAIQHTNEGQVIDPLLDACNQLVDDLSFQLFLRLP